MSRRWWKNLKKYFNVPTNFQHKKSAADLKSDIKYLNELILENERLIKKYSNNPSKLKYHTDLKNKHIKRQIIAQGLLDDLIFKTQLEKKKQAMKEEIENPKNQQLLKELQFLSLRKQPNSDDEEMSDEEKEAEREVFRRQKEERDIEQEFGPKRKPVIKTVSNYTTPTGGRKKRTTKKKKRYLKK